MMAEKLSNWSGHHTFSAARVHYPETVEQVQELVASCNKLRVLGSRHSFNHIADSAEDLISLERFDHTVTCDSERRTATVDGGATYSQLCQQLHRAGYALH